MVLFIFLTLVNVSEAHAQITSSSLTLTVYIDGSVDVEYVVEPDFTYASVNVTLFGKEYTDILVCDEEGLLLDWEPTDKGIMIDSLGTAMATISYSTSSLTNKYGSLWSVSVDAPINMTYILPKVAILVGLTPTPLAISIVEDKATVTMLNGTSKVSYLLGTMGTKEHALVLLNSAEETLSEIKLSGILIDEAETLLQQARNAYDSTQYSLSESLSNSAVVKANEIKGKATDAENAFRRANELIQKLSSELSSQALSQAQSELDSANDAVSMGDYDSALLFAEQAYTTAQNVKEQPKGNPMLFLGMFIVLILLVGGFLYLRRTSSSEALSAQGPTNHVDVDLDSVFRDRPHLRTGDKAVLRYVHESGGAFITDVRSRFDIPKSSAWRMVKRLEQEGVIKVSTVDNETYIQLKSLEEPEY